MSKIPVLEIFYPTIQGEGMVVGQKQCLSVQLVVIIAVLGVILLLRGMDQLKIKLDR